MTSSSAGMNPETGSGQLKPSSSPEVSHGKEITRIQCSHGHGRGSCRNTAAAVGVDHRTGVIHEVVTDVIQSWRSLAEDDGAENGRKTNY